ncbi:MAG: ATP-binding protein [bacterium]
MNSAVQSPPGLGYGDQQEIEARLEKLFRYLLLFSVPAVIASLANAWATGFSAMAFLQLGFYALLVLGLVIGQRLSFRTRCNLYILPVVGFGFIGLLAYGLFGQGLVILVLACLLAALVHPRFYRNILLLCTVLFTAAAFMFLTHSLEVPVNANDYNNSLAAWVSGASTLLVTWLALTTWDEMRSTLSRSNQAVSSREADLAVILESVEHGVIAVDTSMCIRYINPVACRLCETRTEEAIGLPLNEILNINSGNEKQLSAHAIYRGTEGQGDFFLISQDGISRRIRLSMHGTGIDAPDCISHVLAFRDLTDEHRREQQLRHAEKMETLGRLTSGLVHDFNNHISVIQMSREMLEMKLEKGQPLGDELGSIDLACHGAHSLAMQLRGFVRQDDSPGVQAHALHGIVRLCEPLVRKAVPRSLEIEYGLWAQEDSVMLDRGQVQNAILNLVVNAADAIGEKGRIIISTLNRRIEQQECAGSRFDIRPGLYIRLSVSDNGSGIPEEIRSRIFEPFFTTKGSGKGSGLGLASVVDLMVLSEGQVSMETRSGQGTTFHLDFPLSARSTEPAPAETGTDEAETGQQEGGAEIGTAAQSG